MAAGTGGSSALHLGGFNLGGGLRKKSPWIRSWLVMDSAGQVQEVEAGKYSIMRRTGIPARDLRIMDPLLSYPSAVLSRERAIVVNLEHIKSIITAREVLLLNYKDPAVVPFVEDLRDRIMRHHQHNHVAAEQQELPFDGDQAHSHTAKEMGAVHSSSSRIFPFMDDENGVNEGVQALQSHHGQKSLPFEFVAFEACIQAACSSLDNEATTLELEAYPALDKLASQISSLKLDRVRNIKSRLVEITGRVQKVRDEIEHLLDDDKHMAEMYLTEKVLQQQLDDASLASVDEQGGTDYDIIPPDMIDRSPIETVIANAGASEAAEASLQHADYHPGTLSSTSSTLGEGDDFSDSNAIDHIDVKELEMLLEAYFVQIEGTLNKLSTLKEYVDDTEDYINIMLDDKQNHLLQMGILLSTAIMVLTAAVVVAGVMGMNIHIDLFKTGMHNWLLTVGGTSAGCILLYVIAVAWYKHKQLLD